MRDLVAGCMAAYIEEEGVLDLNHLEEAVGSTSQVFAAVHCTLGLVRAWFLPWAATLTGAASDRHTSEGLWLLRGLLRPGLSRACCGQTLGCWAPSGQA